MAVSHPKLQKKPLSYLQTKTFLLQILWEMTRMEGIRPKEVLLSFLTFASDHEICRRTTKMKVK
jgi:hypothetical protein